MTTPTQPDGTSITREAPTDTPVADRLAVERTLGAKCPEPGSYGNSALPLRESCYGPVPQHLMHVMRQIESSIDWQPDDRDRMRAAVHPYRAIPGYGKRPDFMMVSGPNWIRSFEGPDPQRTVYLVHARFKLFEGAELGTLWPEPRHEEGCASTGNTMRVFEVLQGAQPQDVTEKLMPAVPAMTAAEKRRYGRYMSAVKAPACDSHIALDIFKLGNVPSMRWLMDDFDSDTPIPKSDPRRIGGIGWAHFGFVVWDGMKFEILERVPRSLWPCSPPAPAGQPKCTNFGDDANDRFVIED